MAVKDEIESLKRKAGEKLQEEYDSLVALSERVMISAPRANPKPFRSLTQDMQKLETLNEEM